jgi:hypothetical protein
MHLPLATEPDRFGRSLQSDRAIDRALSLDAPALTSHSALARFGMFSRSFCSVLPGRPSY